MITAAMMIDHMLPCVEWDMHSEEGGFPSEETKKAGVGAGKTGDTTKEQTELGFEPFGGIPGAKAVS